LGDTFVVRTAGEVVDAVALGSIEYAIEHLGTRQQ
jgi:carbonic anhydrase